MLIRRNPLSIFAFTLLVAALYFAGMFSTSARVTHETAGTPGVFSVKQGVSQDGRVSISEVSQVPATPINLKSANHSRTLRAFIGPSHGGLSSLFIESARPRGSFVVSGGYTVSQDFPTLSWSDATTLQFYAKKDDDGQLYRIRLDVHLLIADVLLIDPQVLSDDLTGYLVAPE